MIWSHYCLLFWTSMHILTTQCLVKSEIPASLLYELKDVHTLDDLMKVVYIQPNQVKQLAGSVTIDRRISPKIIPNVPRQSSEESEEETPGIIPVVLDEPSPLLRNPEYAASQSLPMVSNPLSSVPDMPRCEPRQTVVDTTAAIDEGVTRNEVEYAIYWPPCITINRCGGCCSTELHQCAPNRTRMREMQVLRLTADQQATQIQLSGFISISVREDESCSCECRVKPEDCHPIREVHRNCQCECAVEYECPAGMVWDAVRCDCVCNTPIHERSCRRRKHYFDDDICGCQCLERYQRGCQPPYVFNQQTCKCQSRTRSRRRPSISFDP